MRDEGGAPAARAGDPVVDSKNPASDVVTGQVLTGSTTVFIAH
jgi:hypothetical protein